MSDELVARFNVTKEKLSKLKGEIFDRSLQIVRMADELSEKFNSQTPTVGDVSTALRNIKQQAELLKGFSDEI